MKMDDLKSKAEGIWGSPLAKGARAVGGPAGEMAKRMFNPIGNTYVDAVSKAWDRGTPKARQRSLRRNMAYGGFLGIGLSSIASGLTDPSSDLNVAFEEAKVLGEGDAYGYTSQAKKRLHYASGQLVHGLHNGRGS